MVAHLTLVSSLQVIYVRLMIYGRGIRAKYETSWVILVLELQSGLSVDDLTSVQHLSARVYQEVL